ncbi:MAG: Holliday junction branch migration protein RuvA [Candidatus Nomurabacteria bacterium]|jgi:Holliday junction DNA helicase RuvA|nr:Holliday junction branch migration protein RuvA [Candidatus Nomurabacteria bacterium]
MIARLVGKVCEKFFGSVIVDVGGVGYEVALSAPDFDKMTLGDIHTLYTYHHIREQSQELFGFLTLTSKKMFELLLGVNGIGPKAALAILSLGSGEQVRNAIANSDSKFIGKASGVGKKSAERVILDLSDKVGLPTAYQTSDATTLQSQMNLNDDATDALIALGYSLGDAILALKDVDDSLTTGERVRLALRK